MFVCVQRYMFNVNVRPLKCLNVKINVVQKFGV